MLNQRKPDLNLEMEETSLDKLLNLLYITWITKCVFYPFIEIFQELKYVFLNRHVEKSLLKIFVVLVMSSASAILKKPHNLICNIMAQITTNLNLSSFWIATLSELLTILVMVHLGYQLTKAMANFACRFFYKDKEFYVTKRKTNQLKERFHKQGYTGISDEDILQLIDFCTKKLRNRTFTDFLGDKSVDWGKSLESIIYEADLEPFLEQQQALKIKLNEIKRNRKILENYLNEKSNKRLSPSLSNSSFSMVPMITIDPIEEDKKPYPQTKKTEQPRRTSTSYNPFKYNESPELTANLESGKLKIKYLCELLQKNAEEMLIYDYKYDLQYKYIDISIGIYPEPIVNNMIFRPITPSYYTESIGRISEKINMGFEEMENCETSENYINLSANFTKPTNNKAKLTS